ncbi:MAG: DUF1173 domain-containing protein [Rhizobiaceae bacterium]|nr:MAG: DUF1173 domain-containing protein [Rhizobiaceae bacterium]
MRRYKLADQVIEEAAANLQDLLADAYRRRIRPLCLCKEGRLPMYIAQIGEQYIVKRMPLSGGGHDPACPSYEPPDELSGLGVLMGSAIQIDPESGISELKVGFSLMKIGSRAAPSLRTNTTDTIVGDAKKLSLRSLLHYLWHQAELTAWTARWASKRHWWNIRWHLIEAAGQMMVKGGTLSEILFIPEPFRATDKSAIEKRRTAALVPALSPKSGPRKLMILVGEVKDFAPTRNGHRLVVRHLPDFPLMLEEGFYRRLQARFENELTLWGADKASHLIAIATFGLTPVGLAVVEDMALMVVAENWVPYESTYEKRLVDALARVGERSVKGLRYNLSAEKPTAAAVLQRESQQIALYVVPPSADRAYEEALDDLIASRPEIGVWVWRTAEGDMPPLPRT